MVRTLRALLAVLVLTVNGCGSGEEAGGSPGFRLRHRTIRRAGLLWHDQDVGKGIPFSSSKSSFKTANTPSLTATQWRRY